MRPNGMTDLEPRAMPDWVPTLLGAVGAVKTLAHGQLEVKPVP